VLILTGGSAKTLREAGLTVRDVADITEFPEMMDGRVKTLHPKIHGGLLAVRDDKAHAQAMVTHGIEGIDLLVSNLYPFEQTVASPPDTALAALVRGLADHAPDLVVKPFPGFIGIHLPDGERRQWSPRLFLSLDATPEGHTRIVGLYGPEIEIWSLFLYGYLITGLLGTFSGLYGCAQLVIEDQPWAFYVTGTMAILAGLLYLAAQLGQKLGAWQTFRLHQAYQAAIGRSAETG
jgi:hypothetical protein